MKFNRSTPKALSRRLAAFLAATATFREARASTKRGRNQLRIAAGIAAIAATGFSVARLIDPPPKALDVWFWFYAGSTVVMTRAAAWLFLTIEGGRE